MHGIIGVILRFFLFGKFSGLKKNTIEFIQVVGPVTLMIILSFSIPDISCLSLFFNAFDTLGCFSLGTSVSLKCNLQYQLLSRYP
jgi:hypothetical protein